MTPRAVVVGEALVDRVRTSDGDVTDHAGGSPANVAVGLARLGRRVELATSLGADDAGTLVRDHLTSAGARLTPGSLRAGTTSIAHAELDAEGAAEYTFDLTVDPPVPDLTDAVVLHVGSIGAYLAPGAAAVDAALARARGRVLVSFDPNIRPAILGTDPASRGAVRERTETLVEAADLVKVSAEDLALLADRDETDVLDLARRWSRSTLVVVTLGARGTWARAADGTEITLPAEVVDVVDTVGAGDAFTAGLLDALWTAGLLAPGTARAPGLAPDAASLEPLLRRSGVVAALTCARRGAEPPTAAEVVRHLERHA